MATVITPAYGDGTHDEIVPATTTVGTQIKYFEGTNNGTNKFTLKGSASQSVDVTYLTPVTAPTADHFLIVNSSGLINHGVTAGTVAPALNNVGCYVLFLKNTSNELVKTLPCVFTNPQATYMPARHYPVIGISGINTAGAGISCANNTIYAFPIYLSSLVNRISFGVQTADVSGTASVAVTLYDGISATTPSFGPIGAKITSENSLINISTTGIKTITIGDTSLRGGFCWVCLRTYNIGTSLVLSTPNDTHPEVSERTFGAPLSGLNPVTPSFGYQYNGQASMPTTLLSTLPDAVITTACGVYVGVE